MSTPHVISIGCDGSIGGIPHDYQPDDYQGKLHHLGHVIETPRLIVYDDSIEVFGEVAAFDPNPYADGVLKKLFGIDAPEKPIKGKITITSRYGNPVSVEQEKKVFVALLSTIARI